METNMQFLQKIVEIFSTGELSEVHSLFSSDYVDHQKPEGLSIDGPEEFKQIVIGARTSLRNLTVTIVDTVSEGNKVVARLHWQGTTATGQQIERETIDMLRVHNGQVVEHWGAEAWVKSS